MHRSRNPSITVSTPGSLLDRPGPAVLTCRDVVWETPEGRRILDRLSFALGREPTALVGANGVGKTTLLRLLVGELAPTAGAIQRRGTIAWLPQDATGASSDTIAERLGIAEQLTAVEAIEAGACDEATFDLVGDAWDIGERALALLDRLGLALTPDDLSRPIGRLSGGEAMRVALARCLLLEPDLLVLDEPTNHLDHAARRAFYDLLDAYRGGILVVSHDRALLRRMRRTLELSSLGLRAYGGGWDVYRAQVEVEREAAARRAEVADQAVQRLERERQRARERQAHRSADGKRAALRRGASKLEMQAARRSAERTSARLGAMSDHRIEQARAARDLAHDALHDEQSIRVDLAASAIPTSKRVIEASGVNVRWPGAKRWLWPDPGISLRLVGPSRLALLGGNGTGKSTLARVLVGTLEPGRGQVRRAELPMAWLDQRCSLLAGGQPLIDSMRRGDPALDAREVYWSLDRFGLGRDAASRRPETLSGGERMRAALASLFGVGTPPQLLVLDEPTNHLDITTVEILESALANYRGAMIVISHDHDLLDAIGIDQRMDFDRIPTADSRTVSSIEVFDAKFLQFNRHNA